MPADRATPLPDRVGLTRDLSGKEWVHRFANGLVIHTEPLLKADTLRILPIGGPQSALMNHLLCFPERVAGRRVFEPFAGSGAIGLMAVKAGAAHVDLLDINPRAAEFQRRNAEASGISAEHYTTLTRDLADYTPSSRCELLLANPPFVPTPDGLAGSLTSAAGPDGNRFVELLFRRLEQLLGPAGEALVFVMQLVRDGEPLLLEQAETWLPGRPLDLTPTQLQPIPFDVYAEAYRTTFASDLDAIDAWASSLVAAHGTGLTVSHYVAHVLPQGEGPRALRDDFDRKFGSTFRTPSDNVRELAVARVIENVVPDAPPQPAVRGRDPS
jgi:hypothetical protein